MMLSETFEPNTTLLLKSIVHDEDIKWVKQNTAILVIHGIGNQLPLETIDQFGRGLIKAYRKEFEDDITLSHHLVSKDDDKEGKWMDSLLRLKKKGSEHFIDIYEYYWAHYTEDQATWAEVNNWLHGVVSGAKTFYKKNAYIGQYYKDSSPFFDSKTGKFIPFYYRLFVSAISKFILTIDLIYRGLLWVVARIPFLGRLAESMMKSYSEGLIKKFTNVVGDVVVYNVVDPKSKFYDTRRTIQDGAVNALRFLIERAENKSNEEKKKKDEEEKSAPAKDKVAEEILFYPSVLVAGHSLGSQVAYDAINRLNLLVNQNEIKHYDNNGECSISSRHGLKIDKQLLGFITFGCPLDKIVFFLRENVPDSEYVRQQMLDHFHGFKLRDLNVRTSGGGDSITINNSLERHLDEVTWRNYFDNKDYVSGGLDYYHKLTNIDCQFGGGRFAFTHSDYWICDKFYKDIVINFLK